MELPPEVTYMIALKLPVNKIINACRINKYWSRICQDEYFWKQIVKRDFPSFNRDVTSWKDIYKDLMDYNNRYFYISLSIFGEEEDLDATDYSVYYNILDNNKKLLPNKLFKLNVMKRTLMDVSEPGKRTFYYNLLPLRAVTEEDFNEYYSSWIKNREKIKREYKNNFFTFEGTYGINPSKITTHLPIDY